MRFVTFFGLAIHLDSLSNQFPWQNFIHSGQNFKKNGFCYETLKSNSFGFCSKHATTILVYFEFWFLIYFSNFQLTTMRRNFTSLLKFTLLCAVIVLLTIFLYKTFFFVHHRNDDEPKPMASPDKMFHPRQGAFFMGSEKNQKHIKIDWHDYKFIRGEELRQGTGEHGAPAFLPSILDDERKQLFDQNGFNALLSDKISLNRSVKDIRHKE